LDLFCAGRLLKRTAAILLSKIGRAAAAVRLDYC